MNVYRMRSTERQTDKIPQLSLVGFLLVYQPEKVQIQIIDHTHSTIVLYVIFVKENPDMQVLKLSGLSICCNHQMVTFRICTVNLYQATRSARGVAWRGGTVYVYNCMCLHVL